MLRVAVPNKGALSEAASEMLSEAGYSTRRGSKTLVHQDEVNGVEFFYLRPRDIAVYVGSGILDAGITGRDLLLESKAEAQEVIGLGFGASRFFYAGVSGSYTSPAQLEGARIATSFPNLVDADLQARGIDAKTVQLDGAIEVSIQLGVADAIADVVETGSTLRAAGLETFGEPLLESEAVLVQRDGAAETIEVLKRRLESVMVARQYVLVDYNIEERLLPQALGLTPGLESPTISPLQET
ncbi:MAG: ATP phosphoribosyltransferase, partial [Brevibacterium aurantiacum]